MNKDKRAEMFRRFQQANPKPQTELVYSSPFELLVLGVEGLKPYIRTIGLYNTKAKNVIEACRVLCNEHAGQVPQQREALEALPGVGRKTANVVLNTAFGQPAMAVDTHIFRVSNRTGLAKGRTVLAVEKALLRFVPKEYLVDAHHWLILHGRYVCLARTPKCPECQISDLCDYRPKSIVNSKGKIVAGPLSSASTSARAVKK